MKIPPHRRLTLANGVRVIMMPQHDVPLIAFDALVRGGAQLDPRARAGVAALTADLLTRGAGARDAYAFADAVEGAGGSLEAVVRSEAVLIHGQFLARDRELMLELLADALLRPRLEQTELAKLRARRIELIRAVKDSEPQSLIDSYARALLFTGHPHAAPTGGSEASLASITRKHVLKFYAEQFGADRLTLVFAGDFDSAWLADAVTRAFGAWRKAAVSLPQLPAPERVRGRRILLIDAPDSAQTYFWIGNVGVARAYPERAALEISNTAFGGSFGSMLMQALRSKNGLTYSASSSFRRGSVPGEFAISSFTPTATTVRALELALQTLGQLHSHGIDAGAINSARSYILGQYPLGFETAADWAATLSDLDLYNLPESYIDNFGAALQGVDTAATTRVIAAAFPQATDVNIVLIGAAAQIRAEVGKLGEVLETPLSAPDFAIRAALP